MMTKMMKIYMKPSVRVVNVMNEGCLLAGTLDSDKSENIKVIVDGYDEGDPNYEIPTISSDNSNPFKNNKYLDD